MVFFKLHSQAREFLQPTRANIHQYQFNNSIIHMQLLGDYCAPNNGHISSTCIYTMYLTNWFACTFLQLFHEIKTVNRVTIFKGLQPYSIYNG